MTTNTQTQPNPTSTPKAKARKDVLREFLAEKGMVPQEIEAALALIAHKPREMDPNKPIPAGLLIASTSVLVESWHAGRANVSVESMLTQRQASLSERLAHGGADAEAARTLDILARLETHCADVAKRTTTDKRGVKKPSAAWKALVHLKSMLSDG